MNMLNKKTITELEKIFSDFKNEVNIKFFGKGENSDCRFCKETQELLQGLSEITSKIKLESFDFNQDVEMVKKFDIKRTPAIVVMDENDRRIRFYGVPGGYEFSSLVESLKLISSGESMLVQETKDFLDSLTQDVHLQVFVTPSCPYCPNAVVLAHRMAYYCPKVTADMVEAQEFPELSQKYSVMGVPRTVINETGFQEGAAPEDKLVDKIKETLGL